MAQGEADETDRDQEAGQSLAHRAAGALEWAVGGVAAVLLVLVLAILVFDWFSDTGGQPELETRVIALAPASGGYRAVVEISNRGEATAAEVHVTGLLATAAGSEQAQAVLDYAPAQSRRTVTLQFTSDPEAGELSVRVEGYREP